MTKAQRNPTPKERLLSWILHRVSFFASFPLFLLFTACGGGGGSESLGLTGPTTGSAQASLTWEAPTANADGSALTDLAGFKIYHGTTSPLTKENSQMIDAGNTTTYTVEGLDTATHYFVVTSYEMLGKESEFSNEV